MKGKIMVVTACAAIAASGMAVAKAPRDATPMKLTLAGEGRWSVSCTFEVGNGNIDREEFRGGKARPVEFSIANLNHGSCDYRSAADKPLTITVEGDGWMCPLNTPANARCEQAMSPGASGSIRLTRRGAR